MTRNHYPTMERHYRAARREDPYLPAARALARARAQQAAWSAGIPASPDYLHDEEVTIDGRAYLVTVEPDTETRPEHFDCYGSVERVEPTERNYYLGAPEPDSPRIRVMTGGDPWYYDPGVMYDAASHLDSWRRRGASRAESRERVRADLEREARWLIDHAISGEWWFRGVTVTAADAPDLSASVWGVDGLDNEREGGGSAYLLEVLSDLAWDVETQRLSRDVAELAVTAHG